jgi:archaellum component FlaF (FlaF/FlaG flagellin family)
MFAVVGFVVVMGIAYVGLAAGYEKVNTWYQDSQRWYDHVANS